MIRNIVTPVHARLIALCAGLLIVCGPLGYAQEGKFRIAQIEIRGSYPEGDMGPPLFSGPVEGLSDVAARFERAAQDKKVEAVLLKIEGADLSWSRVHEFQRLIGLVRSSGKKVVAWMPDAANLDFALASHCDSIAMPESATLMLLGVRAEVTFYKGLLDLVGVKAEMLRVGEFKSAAETYTRTEMSPEFRQELSEILDGNYQQLIKTIATNRKLEPAVVEAAIDEAPLSAKRAKELGLIDLIAYEDEVNAIFVLETEGPKPEVLTRYGKKSLDTDFSGFAGMVKMMNLLSGVEEPKRKSSKPKVAVIHATGAIVSGSSGSDFLSGESTMGSDTMVKAIRQAAEDETVKCIVMRIDSPGGSALASDLIWRAIEKVEKPFVVSMGDVAGSGGYYIAMGADKIFAEPTTITGSIGVVGGKFDLSGLYSKLGVNTTILTRGKNTGILSNSSSLSESERKAFQRMLDEIYVIFTTKAAQGRKMEVEALEKLARGRIYTGVRAKELGLIDEIGSLEDALAAAKKMAGIPDEEKLERLMLPKAVNPLESLLGPIDGSARVEIRKLLPVLPDLTLLFGKERRLVLMPFKIRIQ